MSALPDLAGHVHGIKALDPVVIQCDGCDRTYTGDPQYGTSVQITLCDIQFDKADGYTLRLCPECREA